MAAGSRPEEPVTSANREEPATPLTPGQAAATLADLPITETLTAAVAHQAEVLAEAVRNKLATPPGGPHDQPWSQTGALQASIAVSTDFLSAQVGSSDPAAAPQELGTATIQPRPFLAPTAASLAEPIAQAIGQALADLIARRLR